MSSLLRSTKFVRYFCGAARTLILNSARNFETNLLVNTKNLCIANNVIVRDYNSTRRAEGLEPLLQYMDSEIRKSGRITKRNLDELFDGIKTKNDISSSQSLLVIRCCGDILSEELPEKRTLLVQKIWSVLTDIGVPMDISHYNTLLRVYIENEHPFSPAEFLDELQNKGLQPNHITYQRLIWRYCQQGDIEGATKVLENMRELSLPITVPVLNALVMGHAFLGDTDGARAVLETVSSAGLQATNHTYSLLACGYAKKGDLQGVKQILKMTNDNDILMTNKDIFSIIEAFAQNGHNDKIDAMFEHLEKGPSYRFDAHNAMLNLINKGQEEVAVKILKTYPKPEIEGNFYQGAFFIKQILRANKSPEQIVKTCSDLQENGLIPNALLIALEGALQQGYTELSQQLLNELKNKGTELRQHYYWPLLAKKGKENDEEGLLQILRNMSNEGFIPSRETLQNFVIPYLQKNCDPQNVILKLQVSNVPTITAARSVMLELLHSGRMKEAAEIVQLYKLRGNAFLKEPLCIALTKTMDIKSFASILHITSDKVITQADEDMSQDEIDSVADKNELELDEIVKRAVRGLKTPKLCQELLSTLLSKGIGISAAAAESIEEFLGQNMTSSLSEVLSKLTSSDLELAPIQRLSQPIPRTSFQLENLISHHTAKGNKTNLLKRQLLTNYINENNVEKVNSFVEELEAENFPFPHTSWGQLIEFYCENNDVDKAMRYKELLEKNYPDYIFYNIKIIQLSLAFIKAKRTDEAIELIKANTSDGSNFFSYNTKCWQVLNELAEQKDVEKLKEVMTLMFEKKYAEPSNILLGPLIKVHLMSNDLDSALKEFEYCCKQYRCTPWKGELMKQLIVAEDASKLQWLADMGTQIHGEVNILYDLILAFVECGRLRQARRILETPGLHTRNQRLEAACKRYVDGGKTECIEGLLEATKELSNIDRSKLFYHLLTSYCNSDETDKALGLWNVLQEEGEVPSDEFLIRLGQHLEEKNREIPFVMPEQINKKSKANAEMAAKNEDQRKESSLKIEKLIHEGKESEASDFTVSCLENGIKPDKKVISFLLSTLAEKGNVEKMLLLKPYYNDTTKPINYNHKLNLATVVSGSADVLIDQLQQSLKSAKTDDDLLAVLRGYPRANALNTIIQNEDLAKKCEVIAQNLASKGYIMPMNLLWAEYILNDNTERADELWNEHLVKAEFIKFRRLLQDAYVKKNTHHVTKLIDYLKTNKNITREAIGNVYSRLIQIHTDNKDLENAKIAVEQAFADGVKPNHITRITWRNLKQFFESQGEEFKYNIPEDTKQNSVV